jgi:hypothetical protein
MESQGVEVSKQKKLGKRHVYGKVKDGEWIAPKMRGYHLACCDCGLVHKLDFLIQDGVVVFRAYRRKQRTKLLRKRMGVEWR